MEKQIGILDLTGEHVNPLTGEPYSSNYVENVKYWSVLPVYNQRHMLIDAIKTNRVNLFVSGTGSGKSVLIPKFALHATGYKSKVIVTNPKTLASKKNAEWAAKLMDVPLGTYIGYQYRSSENYSKSSLTKLIFSTDGSLVSCLLEDPALSDYECVVVDEAHERSVMIDILLLLMKKALLLNPNLRLIIMSATIDEDVFMKYFKGSITKFNLASGETNHPVRTIYLDEPVKNYLKAGLKLYAHTILGNEKLGKRIKENNDAKYNNNTKVGGKVDNLVATDNLSTDTLFFVSSVREGTDVCKELNKALSEVKIENLNPFCVELGSSVTDEKKTLIDSEDYRTYISPHTNQNYSSKFILSTNLAESSITIDSLTNVIDSGYVLQDSFDPPTMMRCLLLTRISKDSSNQRKGRIGRTKPGVCYRLYTKKEFEQFQEHNTVDIFKTNITDMMLKLLCLPDVQSVANLRDTLSSLIEPPREEFVKLGLRILQSLTLIDENQHVTEYAKTVAVFKRSTICQSISLMWAYHLNCVELMCDLIAVTNIASGMIRNILLSKPHDMDPIVYTGIIQQFIYPNSDHLTLLNVICNYRKIRSDSDDQNELYCNSNMLNYKLIEKVIEDSANYLEEVLLVMSPYPKKVELTKEPMENVLFAYLMGHFMNIATLHESGKEYRNIFPEQPTIASISRDSFVGTNCPYILYESLFNLRGNIMYVLVSEIPKHLFQALLEFDHIKKIII
jgi:pre-mRNA-splicing factor ATP-dependent RNA helicase DHX15/PRP43